MKNFYSTLLKVARVNSKERNSQTAINRFCSALYLAFELMDLIVYLKSKDNTLKQAFAFGIKGNKTPQLVKNAMELQMGEGIVGTVAAGTRFRCEANIKDCEDYVADIVDSMSELAVPIVYKGNLIGVLDSENASPAFFKTAHINGFEFVAHFIAPLLYIHLKNKLNSPRYHFDLFNQLLIEEQLYLRNDLSQTSVAEMMEVSSSYLARLITQYSKHSFSGIVANLRVEKAKELLLDSTYSGVKINQIYFESGFASKSSFNRSFKEITGVTPSTFLAVKS